MQIVTSWNDYPSAILGYNERALLDWLKESIQPGETWLDVGGHYGYTAMAMSRLVGMHGRVFTFEPTLSTAGCISKTVFLNSLSQITVVPMGLGAEPEVQLKRVALNLGMADSSIDTPQEYVTMMATALDWLWPRICSMHPQVHGVKIDVQGMEIDVLRGMSETLRLWKPKLIVEIHPGVDRELLLEVLESCGYCRESMPVKPRRGETTAQYYDHKSYTFSAH